MGTGYVWSLWHRSFGLAAQLLRFTLSDDNRHTEQRQPDGLDNRRGAQRIRLAIDVRFFWRAWEKGGQVNFSEQKKLGTRLHIPR